MLFISFKEDEQTMVVQSILVPPLMEEYTV